MTDHVLRLGLEVKTVLAPRSSKYPMQPSLEQFAAQLAKSYNRYKESGFSSMHTDIEGDYDGPNVNTEWSVTDDSANACISDRQFPVELVSPIMHFDFAMEWRAEVEHMFRVVGLKYHFGTNSSCGTHFHFSPGSGTWSTDQLQCVSRAVLYFEGAFEVLYPETRRGSQWAKNNRVDNSNFAGLSERECFELIGKCTNIVEIADIMSPDRFYAWNYDNLYFGRNATIEFRRPPGVETPDACLSWMELAISFVQSARQGNGTSANLSRFPQNVDGLKTFLYEGFVSKISNPQLFEPIFQGKTGVLQPRKVNITSQDLLSKKEKESKKK